MSTFHFIRITHATANKTNALNISMTEGMNAHKSRLRVSQKALEETTKKIHDAVKCSVYKGTDISHTSIDYYEEGNGSYDVAGTRILKGERSVRDTSYEACAIPKDWNRHTRVQFATTKITAPITATLKAFGVSITEAQMNEVKKLLKANQKAFIIPKYEDVRGYWGTERKRVGVTISTEPDDQNDW